MTQDVTIIGAGLAGCEAAWRLARAGVEVDLWEMKPAHRSPAHVLDGPCELVCSNSLRSDNPHNAVGLLHEELRRLGSLVLAAADETRVPAGDALAVDRERFSRRVAERLAERPEIRLHAGEVTALPAGAGPGAGGHRAAHRRRAGRRAAGALRRPARLLRRHRPHRLGRARSTWTIAFARSRYDKGSGRRLPQPAARRGAVPRLRRRAAGRREGGAARLRGAALLRGLPAHRGDGGARPRGAGPRAAQAGRAGGPAHRAAGARGGPAAPRGRGRDGLEPGRLPDPPHLAGAAAHLPHAARGWPRPSSCGSGRSTATPSSTRRGCWRPTSRSGPGPTSSWPGRSPASRGTSSRPPAATSRPGPSSTGWPAARSGRRRRPPRWAGCTAT